MSAFRVAVREAARKRLLFTRHALDQMNKPERLISEAEVREVVEQGEAIEEYPEDLRGASGLMMGWTTTGRCLHVVCSPKEEYLAIVTAYLPDPSEWDEAFRRRRR